jgi:hypothetical protein
MPILAAAAAARMFFSMLTLAAAFAVLFGCGHRLQRSRHQHLNQARRWNIGGCKPSMDLRTLQVLDCSFSDLIANYVCASLAQQFFHHGLSV